MEKPEFSPKVVYHIMSSCWNADPNRRPNFADLMEEVNNTTYSHNLECVLQYYQA